MQFEYIDYGDTFLSVKRSSDALRVESFQHRVVRIKRVDVRKKNPFLADTSLRFYGDDIMCGWSLCVCAHALMFLPHVCVRVCVSYVRVHRRYAQKWRPARTTRRRIRAYIIMHKRDDSRCSVCRVDRPGSCLSDFYSTSMSFLTRCEKTRLL